MRKKRKPPAPNERLLIGTPEEIRARLGEFVRKKYDDNWTAFAEAATLSPQTVEPWKPAGDGSPSFENLQRLAQLRLSINWLMSGHGPMQIEHVEPRTEAGKLLHELRPFLQRLAGIGETTEDLAFARLFVTHGTEGLLAEAAKGIWPLYAEAARDLKLLDETVEWRGWLYSELKQLRSEVERGDATAVETVLIRVMQRLETAIPDAIELRALLDERNAQRRRETILLRASLQQAGVTDEEWIFILEVGKVVSLAKDALRNLAVEMSQSPKALLSKLDVVENALTELHAPIVEIASRVSALSPPSSRRDTKRRAVAPTKPAPPKKRSNPRQER
jgi:hypothetical protein